MKSAESIPTNETSKEFLLEKACHWENALIRSAFESLQKFVRLTQRSLEKEIQQLIKTMNDEIKIAVKNKDTTKIKNELEKHKERLNKLKEQILKAIKLEKDFLKTIHERLEHLMVPYKILKNHPVDLDINSWFKIKFNRILADYLLRFGYYQTSKELCNLEKLDSLVDSNIYKVIQKIIKNLQNKKCVQALKWCVENRTRLRKLNVFTNLFFFDIFFGINFLLFFLHVKSSFEFNLRVQEYIQLLEAKKRQPAIDYARKWFSGFYSTHSGDIQKLMGCLAFISDIPNSPYSHLLSPSRWDKLISEFKSDACKLFGLPPFSSLLIDLQAGLSVLKTEFVFISFVFGIWRLIIRPFITAIAWMKRKNY